MAAVSTISTMKVERPRARSSAAPTREKRRSTTPSLARFAGTKPPIWARTMMSAFWRRNVDLPAMFGPVSNQIRPEFMSLGGRLDLIARGDCRGREFFEHLKLEVKRAVGGVGDFRFELAELGGGESDLAGEGLAVNEGCVERRAQELLAVRGGDVDEIAEHVIVPYLQCLDAGVVGVAGLQLGYHLAGFV